MIKVENLKKHYGEFLALDSINFEVKKGEILGFLGPNGAGKTTTMRILTTYLPFDSGSVKINGVDIRQDANFVKKKIGYIPENTPLYSDLNVIEYLSFLADVHQLKGNRRTKQLQYVIENLGLEKKLYAEINELSKGYRQRVGLAQALIHDPDILILDEPTAGLDPNQIVEIRSLIKEVGKKKTIIFCTHILPEVESTCDRVIIINNGQIAGEGTVEQLKNNLEGKFSVNLEVLGKVKESLDIIKGIKGVEKAHSVKSEDTNTKMIQVYLSDDSHELRARLIKSLVAKKVDIIGIQKMDLSFEDVFSKLTQ